ncbi:MAG: hypothetical protein WC784_01375 [Candidatus Shapirobacteria bacterium]
MKIWRKILPFLWIIIFIHFLKDITQDILQIPTFFDIFGNIQEDLSNLPNTIRLLIITSGVLSFFGEIFLLIAIPLIRKRKQISVIEKWIIGTTIFMLIYFLSVLFLDPKIIIMIN